MSVIPGIAKAVKAIEGQHYENAPNHGRMLVAQLHGEVERISLFNQDDPALLALDYLDATPRIAGLLIQLQKWCQAIKEATPDQLFETGAQ